MNIYTCTAGEDREGNRQGIVTFKDDEVRQNMKMAW